MEIDITEKSQELKTFVGQFETTKFLGEISMLMPLIKFGTTNNALEGLTSPQRQLMYIAGLNISAKEDKENIIHHMSDDDLNHIKKLLNEIESGYSQFFYPKKEEEISEEWLMKREIAMPTFLSYFNQGLLNYEEQIIERIEKYFTPFDTEIYEHYNLHITDFIDIYNFLDKIPNNFLNDNINQKEGQQSWEEFAEEMIGKGIMPQDWNKYMPKHFKEMFNFVYDKGKMYRYSKDELADKFGEEKTNAFLNIFTCNRNETEFLYYTEQNPILFKPIFNIDNNNFQIIELHHLIQAIYNELHKFCAGSSFNEKFYAHRGKKLEEKIEEIFKRFFKNDLFVYKGFYTQEGNEQDLLFITKGLALIVEAKASKRDEPRREPEKAYPLILSNFDEVIQKGYDQTYRVKSKFIDNEILEIYKDQKLSKNIFNLRTKNYHHSFSIIVTLERFGKIQTDLSDLLEIYEDDEFPWSICIDDLEVFLLQMEKLGKKKSDLINFLSLREKLHGRLITADELEVCGAFINGKINYKNVNNDENIFALTPDLADIFDNTYHKGGLGFNNEKNLDIKQSDKYMIFGQ